MVLEEDREACDDEDLEDVQEQEEQFQEVVDEGVPVNPRTGKRRRFLGPQGNLSTYVLQYFTSQT